MNERMISLACIITICAINSLVAASQYVAPRRGGFGMPSPRPNEVRPMEVPPPPPPPPLEEPIYSDVAPPAIPVLHYISTGPSPPQPPSPPSQLLQPPKLSIYNNNPPPVVPPGRMQGSPP